MEGKLYEKYGIRRGLVPVPAPEEAGEEKDEKEDKEDRKRHAKGR